MCVKRVGIFLLETEMDTRNDTGERGFWKSSRPERKSVLAELHLTEKRW